METLTAVVNASARFQLTYRRLVLILTVPDNVFSRVSISPHDTRFEEKALLPCFFLKTKELRLCCIQLNITCQMISNICFDDSKLKIV